ncbi:54S ribosomal protein, mitochondrial [Tulasnella sp. 424]|nr:54S ribosomal protein, mitochondrial [Tulasnella sp. 424]KAG8976764.1 54S ribosomal protein, mitochondrial [Tulasnella sp. 425]
MSILTPTRKAVLSSIRPFSTTANRLARVTDAGPSLTKKTPPTSLVQAQPPVYIPLSSFLRRKAGEPRSSNQVVALDPEVFSHPIRRDILHLCVVHYRDGLRQGSASTKTRAEVSGSGRKLRPQKGSGRARLGDRGSPMLRGGGRAFGPKPRDFSTKLPRKVVEMGMRVALSAKLGERSLSVVESLEWDGAKTKDLSKRLAELAWPKVLFVSGHGVPELLRRTTGNLQGVEVVSAEELTIYDILRSKRIVLDVSAVEWLERRYGKDALPLAGPGEGLEFLQRAT